MVKTVEFGKTIEFGTEAFPLLTLREDYTQAWNSIGLDDIDPKEREPLLGFLEQINYQQLPNFDPSEVLLVKAENGVLSSVYSPAIWRKNEDIVLQVGKNSFPVTQKEDKLICGQLKGKIAVIEKTTLEGEVYPEMSVSFVSKARNVYRIPIKIATKDLGLTVAHVTSVVINEEPIVPLLLPVPTPAIKMHELGVGEYQLQSFVTQSEGEFGDMYKLYLLDGQAVMARGNVKILLDSGWRPNPNKALTLVITKIEKLSADKYSVDCALRERLPALPPSSAPVVTVDVATQQVDEDVAQEEEVEALQPVAKRDLVAVGASTTDDLAF